MPNVVSTNPLGSLGTTAFNINAKCANTPVTEITDTIDSSVTVDGYGSCKIDILNMSGTRGPYWNNSAKIDNRSNQRSVILAWNPTKGTVVSNIAWRYSDGANARENNTSRMLPGWNFIPINSIEGAAAGSAYQYKGFTRFTAQMYTGMSSFLYGKFSSLSYNVCGVTMNPTGKAYLILGFDDCFYTVYQYAWPVLQKSKYAGIIRASLNAVADYSENATRPNFNNDSQIMTPAQIEELYSSGMFKVANHTYNHYNLESGQAGTSKINGPDPAIPYSREWMFGLSTGNIKLTLNGVTTGNIAYNASAYAAQNTIDTAWGAGVCEVGHSFGTLTSNNGFRLKFTQEVTLTANVNSTTLGTCLYCRPAFTVEEIAYQYSANKAWIEAYGWKGGNCAIGPMGSWGENVFAGLDLAGMDTYRFMYENHSSAHRGLTLHQQALLNPYTQGAQLFAGNAVNYNVSDAIKAVLNAEEFGGVANVYCHNFKSGSSSSALVGSTDFETFLDFVMYEVRAGRLEVVTPDEYWDILNGRSPIAA